MTRLDPAAASGPHRRWHRRDLAGRRPIPRRPASIIAAAALLAALSATPAIAIDSPPRLEDQVTDQAGVLTASEEDEVALALDALRAEHGVQLFIAYLDSTGGDDVNAFAEATAEESSLGGNDALILVAVEDRSYSMWVGPSLDEITDDEIDTILTETLEPALVAGDFAGAMVSAAGAVGEAVTGAPVATTPAATPATPAPTTSGAGTGSGSPAGGINVAPVVAFILIAGGLLLVGRAVLVRRRHRKAAAAALASLSAQANRALLAADEATKDAANDVEFAAAQWGDAEVVPYRDAIRQAGDELRAAFSLRQRLDDAEPERPPERDAMLREIIARCARAGELLDAQEQRFDQLRDLEAAAPGQLAALPPAIDGLHARRATGEQTLARLLGAYAPSATASVTGNLEEAGKALDAASAEAARGARVVASKPSEGVIALRRSQEAMARALQLVEGVERLAAGLDDATARIPAELDAASRDVASARDSVARLDAARPSTPAGPGTAGAAEEADALRAAETALEGARRAAEARPLDPLAALQGALAANQAADTIIARVADAEAQAARRRQVADAAMISAQGHVSRATDYITTRRHGVGETARTRAAEAQVRLEEARALVASDPEGATAAANRSTQLADEAYRLAAGEFEGWGSATGPVAGPYHGGDGAVVSAVLGGILGAVLTGAAGSGRGQGSGWGGSPWGGSGSGSTTGGFGVPSGPPRGGGGGRARGGGFSIPSAGGFGGGGGGRVRGGRW